MFGDVRLKRLRQAVVVAIAAVAAATIGLAAYATALPEGVSRQETLVVGGKEFDPGSRAGLRVLVRDRQTMEGVAGAGVEIKLLPAEGKAGAKLLYSGHTGSSGTVDANFAIPDGLEGKYNLIVEASSPLGSDKVANAVTVNRRYRVLVSTDKPVYQPGQTIHIRALALAVSDLKPAASQPVELVVEDAKGNKVFKRSVTASSYGVASVDFDLASEVNVGQYKITASAGGVTSERAVNVKRYVLPKFKLELSTEKPYYLPGETVKGKVSANYFFGKPVQASAVDLKGLTFDVQQREAVNVTGKTDQQGNFSFQFSLPSYFVGGRPETGRAALQLEATVVDATEHAEVTSLSLPVASSRLLVEAVAEGATLKPGVENIVYIMTGYPDGTPANAQVSVGGQTLQTGKYGIVEYRFVPGQRGAPLTITARDETGNQGRKEAYFPVEGRNDFVLVRPQQPMLKAGETLRVDVFGGTGTGAVYLDLVRGGQTVSTHALDLENGRASLDVDIPADLFGTLDLHAYKIMRTGEIVGDRKLVVVSVARDLMVSVKPDKEVYLPGDQANVEFRVTKNGTPVPAALGVNVVDESVFAVEEQDAGLAKLYFLLEKELLQPRYEIHGFSFPDVILRPGVEEPIRAAQERAAAAALSLGAKDRPGAVVDSSHVQRVQNATARQTGIFKAMVTWLPGGLVAIAVVFCGAIVAGLARRRLLRRTLVASSILALPAAIVGVLLVVRSASAAVPTAPIIGLGLVAGGILAACTLARPRSFLSLDRWLALTYLVFLPLLVFATFQGRLDIEETALRWTLASLALMAAALFVRGVGFGFQRNFVVAIGAITFALVFTPLSALATDAFYRSPLTAGVLPAQGGLGVVEGRLDAVREGGPMSLMAVPAAADSAAKSAAGQTAQTSVEQPRLRQFFPETMYANALAVTDDRGYLKLQIPVADSITTWRLSALASSQVGDIGAVDAPLKVFQDFFVDLDLPVSLTQGDEVSVPVGVFNYLPQEQTVTLKLTTEPWFQLLDQAEKQLVIGSNDIKVVRFRIRAASFGNHKLTVTAIGQRKSDAISRDIEVVPAGRRIEVAASDRLTGDTGKALTIPAGAISGTVKAWVKVYPGFASQVVEGLDSILRMPNGCFEQTSSTTYPNVLVLSYMKNAGRATPEVRMKAERYINLGYQRLLTFEVRGGGFSLFGQPPADTVLTAYGLMEFSDMKRVHEVDQALIDRTGRWLLSQQQADGTWRSALGLTHNQTWDNLKNSSLPVTAYVAWSLNEAGFKAEPGTMRAVAYLKQHIGEAEDPYVLALVGNALASADPNDPSTKEALDRLNAMRIEENGAVYWKSGVESFMGGRGQTASIETTALAVHALIKAGMHPDTANKALTHLIRVKDPRGTWYTTQATVLALRALLLSVTKAEATDATVRVSANGGKAEVVRVTPQNSDVMQVVSLMGLRTGENSVDLKVEGKGNMAYQLTAEYYLPWSEIKPEPQQELMAVDVSYDRAELQVNDTVRATVDVRLNKPGVAQWVIVDLGIPPGFEVMADDLNALVSPTTGEQEQPPLGRGGPPQPLMTPVPAPSKKPIKRYELTGRQIIIYLESLSSERPLTFSFRFKAKYPVKAAVPATRAYDYYNPDVSGIKAGGQVLVRE